MAAIMSAAVASRGKGKCRGKGILPGLEHRCRIRRQIRVFGRFHERVRVRKAFPGHCIGNLFQGVAFRDGQPVEPYRSADQFFEHLSRRQGGERRYSPALICLSSPARRAISLNLVGWVMIPSRSSSSATDEVLPRADRKDFLADPGRLGCRHSGRDPGKRSTAPQSDQQENPSGNERLFHFSPLSLTTPARAAIAGTI